MPRRPRAIRWRGLAASALLALAPRAAGAAVTVPTDVQMPGTQPGQTSQIESVA